MRPFVPRSSARPPSPGTPSAPSPSLPSGLATHTLRSHSRNSPPGMTHPWRGCALGQGTGLSGDGGQPLSSGELRRSCVADLCVFGTGTRRSLRRSTMFSSFRYVSWTRCHDPTGFPRAARILLAENTARDQTANIQIAQPEQLLRIRSRPISLRHHCRSPGR